MLKKIGSVLNFKSQKDAEKMYEKTVKALKRLAQDDDFKKLVEYWEIEYNIVDNKIDALKGKELEEAVLERKIVKRHLNWISSLLQ